MLFRIWCTQIFKALVYTCYLRSNEHKYIRIWLTLVSKGLMYTKKMQDLMYISISSDAHMQIMIWCTHAWISGSDVHKYFRIWCTQVFQVLMYTCMNFMFWCTLAWISGSDVHKRACSHQRAVPGLVQTEVFQPNGGRRVLLSIRERNIGFLGPSLVIYGRKNLIFRNAPYIQIQEVRFRCFWLKIILFTNIPYFCPGCYKEMSSWLTNSALVYEPRCGGGGVAGSHSQAMSTAVQRSPHKFWISNSIFNLWFYPFRARIVLYILMALSLLNAIHNEI